MSRNGDKFAFDRQKNFFF